MALRNVNNGMNRQRGVVGVLFLFMVSQSSVACDGENGNEKASSDSEETSRSSTEWTSDSDEIEMDTKGEPDLPTDIASDDKDSGSLDTDGDAGSAPESDGDTDTSGEVHPEPLLRRSICVIADFANQTLEDLEGDGLNAEDDVAAVLDAMADHWAWLSRGTETMEWDIVRVTLPIDLSDAAYAGWVEYRNAVVTLLLEKISVDDYDVDGDGDVDTVWIVAANNGEEYPYLIGGASFNAGAHVFVDGQASDSILRGAIGNFNHEIGHTLGLPDLYGDYTTVDNLSLMANSWAFPPHDFSAWERIELGWTDPMIISETTSDIVLPSANESFAAVKIPTAHSNEYFVLEYRVTPESGYGSQSPGLDGLLVYHLFEGSNQNQAPPLLKVEPADGRISAGSTADRTDSLYPNNPEMALPFTVKSYYDGADIIRIDNVAWARDGIRFDLEVLPYTATGGLLDNGSFETGAHNRPDKWTTTAWSDSDALFVWDDSNAVTGERSAAIQNTKANDASWEQSLGPLEIGKSYSVCGWIKGKDIAGTEGPLGATISVVWKDEDGDLNTRYTDAGLGSFDFREACVVFQAEIETVTVQCRLGHWGSIVTGKMWCDDISMVALGDWN